MLFKNFVNLKHFKEIFRVHSSRERMTLLKKYIGYCYRSAFANSFCRRCQFGVEIQEMGSGKHFILFLA